MDERFTLSGDSAEWRSSAERGGRRLTGAAFFVPLNGPITSTPLLVHAALAASGGRLPLLPVGEARIEKVRDRKVRAEGRSVRVTQYQRG